jgi:hypothetical protein
MLRASGTYTYQGQSEKVFEVPASVNLLDGLEQAKRLSNDYLSVIFNNSQPEDPIKKRKEKSDSEENEG